MESQRLGTLIGEVNVLSPHRRSSIEKDFSPDVFSDQYSPRMDVDSEPCSSFFRCIVKWKELEYMDTYWLPGIHDEIRNWKGFRHRLVIPPPVKPDRHVDDDLEFVVILYFLGIRNLRSWSTSPERAFWVDAAREKNIYVGSMEDHSGVLSEDIDTEDKKGGRRSAASRKLLCKPTRVELHESMSKAPLAVPPPKYKLFLVIWFCVMTVNLTNNLAGGSKFLSNDGLAFSAYTFIGLCHQMVFIIYAMAPFIMSLYIVEKWIKSPRCPVHEMTPLYSVFDQGLQIFAAAPKETPSAEIMNRLDRLEGKVDRLKRVNHELLLLINARSETLEKAFQVAVDQSFSLVDTIPQRTQYSMSSIDLESQPLLNNDERDDESSPKSRRYPPRKVSIIDPALLKLQQYNIAPPEVALVAPKVKKRQSIYGAAAAKKLEMLTFHSEGTSPHAHADSFSFHNPGVDFEDMDPANLEIHTHQTATLAPDSFLSQKTLCRGLPIARTASSANLSELENQTEARSCAAADTHPANQAMTMVVTHHVKWESTLDFEIWIKDMFDKMSQFNGFIGQNTTPPLHDGDPYVNAFTFESYADLYAFLSSPERKQLMRDLLPLLEATSVAQISSERIIHDAFSELFIATGGSAPGRPPPLWKITVLTVVSLQFIVWSISGTLIPIFQRINVNIGLVLLTTTFITVLVNIYIGLPLMHLFFGSWLRIPRPLQGDLSPWVSVLDVGLKGWQRLLMMFVYFSTLLGYGFWRYFP